MMPDQGIENIGGTLDSIVAHSRSTPISTSDVTDEALSEATEERTEKVREEKEAIRDGIRAAQNTATQIEANLRKVEQSLSQLTNNLNATVQDGVSSSIQTSLLEGNRQSLSVISNANQALGPLTSALPQVEEAELQNIDTSGLENLATGLGTNEEALQARESLKTALKTTLGNRTSLNLIAKHLGQQLVTSEDVAQGTLGLSRFTDADLLLDVAKTSQLEEQLHTEVLVKAEAGQQNRRIGRLLNQLT